MTSQKGKSRTILVALMALNCGESQPEVIEYAGLVWTAEATDLVRQPEARAHCDSLTLGGRSDWRVPTEREIRALVQGCPAVESGGECNVADGLEGACLGVCPESCYLADPFTYPCRWHWTADNFIFTFQYGAFEEVWDSDLLANTRCVAGAELVPPPSTPFVREDACATTDEGTPLCVLEVGTADLPQNYGLLTPDGQFELYLFDDDTGQFLGCTNDSYGVEHVRYDDTDYLANAYFNKGDFYKSVPLVLENLPQNVRIDVVWASVYTCPSQQYDENDVVFGQAVVSGSSLLHKTTVSIDNEGLRYLVLGPPTN